MIDGKGKGIKTAGIWNGTPGNDTFSVGAGNNKCIAKFTGVLMTY